MRIGCSRLHAFSSHNTQLAKVGIKVTKVETELADGTYLIQLVRVLILLNTC